VPGQLFGSVRQYMANRRDLMNQIEDKDSKQLESRNPQAKQAQR
jgi:hypothetical protein